MPGQGSASASDVPGKYDVSIAGMGYMLLQSLEPNLPFRSHRGIYSYSPTFITRSNITGAYGDNTQDFWLSVGQNDWSLGEGQSYLRTNDTISTSRYYSGSAVDNSTPGQVGIRRAIDVLPSTGQSIVAGFADEGIGPANGHVLAGTSHLFTIDTSGTVTDKGAHGAGVPVQYGITADSSYVYIAGTSGIQKWDGTSFTSFSSTTGAGSLATLNNALYAHDGANLRVFSTGGAPTILYTWQNNVGAALSPAPAGVKILPFGGDLLIYFPQLQGRPQLWIYDGTGADVIAELPKSVRGYDAVVHQGIVFLSGSTWDSTPGSGFGAVPCIYYMNNGDIGLLWKSTVTGSAPPALGDFAGRLVFTDNANGFLREYDLGTGSISTIGPLASNGNSNHQIASGSNFVTISQNDGVGNTGPEFYPDLTGCATSATVTSSLIDFESSLTKLFRGVVVDFDSATDGNGGSVDIAYAVGTLTGSYTSLATGITSGTEYLLTGVTGRSISIQVTLNKGTSTNGPVLKRAYVRAAPELQTFRQVSYILDLSGVGFGEDHVHLADGTVHPLSGHQQAANLNAAILEQAPVTVTDRFGTFTAVFDLTAQSTEIYDWREGWDNPKNPGGFIGKITLRQI